MPEWVKDHDKWEKAKEKAKQEGKSDKYGLITDIYKKMGGRIKHSNLSSKRIRSSDWIDPSM